MAMGHLRTEEKLGLALAVALHAALFGLLALHRAPMPASAPQAISVTLPPDAGLTATAPTHDDAAADVAPTLGAPPPPASAAAPAPTEPPPASAKVEPPVVAKAVPAPEPVRVTQPAPVNVTRPRPASKARPKPAMVKSPEPDAANVAPAKPAHKHSPSVKTNAPNKPLASVKDWDLAPSASPDHRPAGASRIGNDFLKGVAGGKIQGKAARQGAAVIGPEVKSALSGAIAGQLKPHWMAPQGADADKLVTILSWDLDADGSLAGAPRVVRQEGITDSNRPQAARHAEQAIRAVELAAPFHLPPEYYALWKHVASSRFDRTLSQ